MGRRMSLEDVYDTVRVDRRWDHLRGPGMRVVKGRGEPDRPLAMVVGAAPGATDQTVGKPFVGKSGVALKVLMAQAGLYAEDWQDEEEKTYGVANAWVTNVVKYCLRPPNREVSDQEILFALDSLRMEWAAVGSPRLIVAAGSVARKAFCPVEQYVAAGTYITLLDGKTTVWVQHHPKIGILRPERRPELEAQWKEMGEWMREAGLN